MPRPRGEPETQLGVALVEKRGERALQQVAEEVGVSYQTLSRLERAYRPSADTAVKLARWLGWSVEQVLKAADEPAPDEDASMNNDHRPGRP